MTRDWQPKKNKSTPKQQIFLSGLVLTGINKIYSSPKRGYTYIHTYIHTCTTLNDSKAWRPLAPKKKHRLDADLETSCISFAPLKQLDLLLSLKTNNTTARLTVNRQAGRQAGRHTHIQTHTHTHKAKTRATHECCC
jgi:hypothetical protein